MPYSVKLLLPQFLVNLMQKHAQHAVLDVVIAQQQAEEVLILGKSLNQRVICIVVEAELKVLLGVVLGRGLQLIRMQQQVLDLQHNFRHGTAIIALAYEINEIVVAYESRLSTVRQTEETNRQLMLAILLFAFFHAKNEEMPKPNAEKKKHRNLRRSQWLYARKNGGFIPPQFHF